MAFCRTIDADGQVVYANYHGETIQPVSGINDENFFSLSADRLSAAAKATTADSQPTPDRLLPPVPTPEKVICIGLNYLDHAIETGSEPPTEPVVFSKFNTAIVGHGDAIKLPRVAQQVDYEAELVVVIGRTAKHVSQSDAMNHVFGYACGHDVSARDWQKGRPGGQWLLGKTFDTFAPIGPCLATTDEISDPSDLRVRMHLNGEVVQDSTTAQLIFDIPTLIAHLSTIMTLNPGDLIFTGTPPGVGAAKTPPVFLKPGDVCGVEIDGLGVLQNTCVAD